MSLENLVIQNNTVLGYNGKNANIVIPEGVTEIGEGAFKNCSFAKVVTIESSVLRTIGNNAFEGCTALEQIKLNSLRGAIGDKAFYNCSKLESIEIPHGAMEIGSKAFGGCAELSLVCIPSSVMVIKADAFDANASRRLLFICDDKTDAKKYAEKCGIPNKNKHGLSILRNALAESKKKRENLGAKTFSLFGQKIYAPNSLGLKVSIVQHYNGEKDAFYRNIYSKVPQKLTDEFAVKDIATIAETFARNTQNRLADQGVFTTIERISLCVEQPADKLIDFMTALGNVRQSLLGIGNSQLSNIKNDLTAQAEDKVTGLSYGIIGDSLSLALHAIDDYRERQRQRAAAYAEAERKYNVATAQVSEVLERNYKDIINKHVKNNLRQVTEAYIDALCDTEIRLLWEYGLLAEISESDYSEEKSTEILEKANGCDPEYTIGLALKTYPINLSALILAGQQNLATDELVDYIQFMNIKDETTVRCILQSANVSWKRVIEYWNENEKAKVCEDAISARVDKITQRIEALANGIVEKATAADYQTQIEKLITADQWEFACKVKPVINHKLNKKLNFTQAIANTGEGFLELGSRIADYNSRYTNADVFATNTVNADMPFKDKILALAPYKDILEERKLNDLLKNDIMAFFGNILSQQLPEYDGNNPNKIEEAIRGLYVKALGKDTLSIMGDMGLIVSIPELGQKSHEQEYRAFEWVKVLTRLHIKEEQQRYAEELKEKLIPAGTFAKAFMIAKEYAYKLNPADCVYLMKEYVCKVNAILKKLPETIAIPENTPEKEIIHFTQKAIYEIMNDDCWAVFFCADAAYSKDCGDIQRCMRQLVETTNDTVLCYMWYTLGCGLLQKARNIRDVKRAKELLKKAGTYRDSRKRLKECDQKEAFFIKKKKKMVISLSVAAFSAVMVFLVLLFTIIVPYFQYNNAIRMMHGGDKQGAALAFGKLGDYKDARAQSMALWDEIAARQTICACGHHTVGIKTDGTVVAVGNNDEGQCNVSWWRDVVAVDGDGWITVGLCADGTVVTTGDDIYGRLNVYGWSDIVSVAIGARHTVGLKMDGTVVAVGENDEGQCDVSRWTDIVAISASSWMTFGLRVDGTVVTAGSESVGHFDVSDWSNIVAIDTGTSMVAGLKADGTVVTTSDWIDVTNWSDIIAISVDGGHITGWKKDGTMLTAGSTHDADFNASSWKDVVAITIGSYNTVGLKRDGTVLVSVSSDHQGVSKASKWKDIEIPNWAK